MPSSIDTLDEEPPADDEPAIGDLVDGRYRLRARLGRGAAAVVYRAHDERLDRSVAIKMIGKSEGDTRARERLEREARALARLRHDNVVQVHAFGCHRGQYWICMEHVLGSDLDTLLREHASRGTTMPFGTALDIVRQIASGLAAIHEHGLVHLDVKPGNVVLEAETGRAVLVDFGIARPRAMPANDGSFVGGTPSYMAPEQVACFAPETMTPQTDLYGLACTAFELFTGRRMYAFRNAYEIVLAHVERPPPRLSSIRPELAPLDDVLGRALAKAPEDRQRDCATLISELDAVATRVFEATACPTSHVSVVASPSVRVLLLVRDASLREQLVGTIGRVLDSTDDDPEIECVSTAAEAVAAFARRPADIFVVDDEAVSGAAEAIVAAAHVLVIGDRRRSTPRADVDARVLPRPPAAQVLRTVIARFAAQIAESRAARTPLAALG